MDKPVSVIRKVAVGLDYKNSMTYIVGQRVLNNEYEISLINREEKTGSILLFITNSNYEVLIWKEFTQQVPIYIEYYIEYAQP